MYKKLIVFALVAFVLVVTAFTGRSEMGFSDLMAKVAKGEQLTVAEQNQMLDEARQMEQTASIIRKIIQPGTSTLAVDNLIVDNGTVVLDNNGIFIKNDIEGHLSLGDVDNNRDKIYIASGPNGGLYLINLTKDTGGTVIGGIWQRIIMNDDSLQEIVYREDPAQVNRTYLRVMAGVQGARFALDNNALIDFRTEGASGGSTFMRMRETTATPPAGSTDAYHMYMKGDKLIIQFDAAGTPHYFYLDLTATTNQSWIYSATAP